MLAVMMMPVMVSCGDDDDDNGSGGGSNISYTPEEIVSLLNGGWSVYGHCEMPPFSIDNKVYGKADYEGEIKFSQSNKGTLLGMGAFLKLVDWKSPLNLYIDQYSIKRKNGKTYITLPIMTIKKNSLDFQIVNLTKTKLKLVADEYIDDDHYYLSIISE